MKPKTTAKPQKKPSQSSLAARLGVSRQLIAAHHKKADAPALDDIAGWITYLAQHGRIGSAPPDLRRAIAVARLGILTETKSKLSRENQISAGELMPTPDARRQAAAAWAFIFNELERLQNELPPDLAGRTAVEIGIRLHAFTERLRTDARAKFEKIA